MGFGVEVTQLEDHEVLGVAQGEGGAGTQGRVRQEGHRTAHQDEEIVAAYKIAGDAEPAGGVGQERQEMTSESRIDLGVGLLAVDQVPALGTIPVFLELGDLLLVLAPLRGHTPFLPHLRYLPADPRQGDRGQRLQAVVVVAQGRPAVVLPWQLLLYPVQVLWNPYYTQDAPLNCRVHAHTREQLIRRGPQLWSF